jgi:hypothetical protein
MSFRVMGRRIQAWHGVSHREATEYLEVPAGLVEASVTYCGEYRDEIDKEIEFNEAEYERGRTAAAAGEQALRS